MQDMTFGGVTEYPSNYSFSMEDEQLPAIDEQQLEEQQGKQIAAIMQSEVPEYLKQLALLGTREDCQHTLRGISPEEKLEILSLYEGSVHRPFGKYLNKTVTILGCIIWYHPPIESFDGSGKKPGWDQILFLTDEFESGLPVVIKGSAGLTNHVRGMFAAKGWYMWDTPVRYTLLRESNSSPFQMINQDRIDRMQAAKEARKKAGK